MLKTLKSNVKRVLVALLSVITAGSGLAASAATIASADSNWVLYMDRSYYISFLYTGVNGKTSDNNSSDRRVTLFRLYNKSTGESKVVFCIQHGVMTNSGYAYADDYAQANSYWDDMTQDTKNRVRLAVEWYKNSGLYPANGRVDSFNNTNDNNYSDFYRVATQMYIWEQTLNDTLGGGNGSLDWDSALNNNTGSSYQKTRIKAAYDDIVSYVNSNMNRVTKVVKPQWDNTKLELLPGQSATINDVNGVLGNGGWAVSSTGIPQNVTVKIEGNSLKITVDEAFEGIFNGTIAVRKTAACDSKVTVGKNDLIFGGHEGNKDIQVLAFPGDYMNGGCLDPEADIDLKIEAPTGSIKVHKVGEELVSSELQEDGTTKLIWKEQYMSKVQFELHAAEDIYGPDGKLAHVKDSLVKTLVTDIYGEASVEGLPLGQYYIKEVIAPEEHSIYEATSDIKYISLSRDNMNYEGVVESEVTFINQHLIIDPTIYKVAANLNDKSDESKGYEYTPLKDVKFGIYNAEAILNNEDEEIVAADTLLATMVTGEDGMADVQVKLPFGKYYIVEMETPEGYYTNEEKYEFELVWNQEMQDNSILVIDVANKENPIINYEIPTLPQTGIRIETIIIAGSALVVAVSLGVFLTQRKKALY